MPRYYFHYRGADDQVVEDRLGSRHIDLEAVEREAQLVAREILTEELEEGGPIFTPRCLEIEDEAGEVVLYLPFWASVAIGPTAMSSWVSNHQQKTEPGL